MSLRRLDHVQLAILAGGHAVADPVPLEGRVRTFVDEPLGNCIDLIGED